MIVGKIIFNKGAGVGEKNRWAEEEQRVERAIRQDIAPHGPRAEEEEGNSGLDR